jgi:NAD(P)-dependent dehydrogenase (short-subunit alcohol dehydrogenase family)
MMGAYVASKFALEGLTDVMRQDASERGIEIILLQPGTTDTPALQRSRNDLADIIAKLPERERALYGKLYRQMLFRVTAAAEDGGIMPATVIAETVIVALESDPPRPRYRIGPDAEFLIEASRTKSDCEIDALILDIYRSAPFDTE